MAGPGRKSSNYFKDEKRGSPSLVYRLTYLGKSDNRRRKAISGGQRKLKPSEGKKNITWLIVYHKSRILRRSKKRRGLKHRRES